MDKSKDDDTLFLPVENPKVQPPAKVVKDIKPPVALRPGVEWSGLEAEVTSEPLDSPNPDWNAILLKWGYDPDYYEIVEPVKVSQWDVQADGGVKTLWSYKAGVKTKSKVKDVDYSDLIAEVKKYRKPKTVAPDGDQAFIVNIADTQFGKSDGDGLEGTVDRMLKAIDSVENRIIELRKIGRKLGILIVAGVGDVIENCSGSYSSQAFTVELNRREQIRIARRLIRDAIMRWSKLFQEVIVLAVPGNHGENKGNDRRPFTTPGDNDDVAIFEMVAEILAANPEAFGHVKFYLPEDEIYMLLDVCGTKVAWAHGHISGGSGSPQNKIREWWKNQSFGESPLGDADILVTGHYHHFSVVEFGPKTHIQCPTLESESTWWKNLKAEVSRPGMLTFVVDKNGYSDLAVL